MLVSIVALAAPTVALASTEALVVATEEPAGSTTAGPQFEEGSVPAEIAPPAASADEEQPWTTRFLAPTLLAIGVITLVGSVLYYGVRLRSRFEVID